MKNHQIKTIFCLLSLFWLTACHNDEDASLPNITPEAQGTYTDQRDGNEYHWIRINGLEWMTDNLRYDLKDGINNSFYLDYYSLNHNLQEDKFSAKYGFLYTYQGAIDAVPEGGWRVPTDDDWKSLERSLGMSKEETDAFEWRGATAGELMKQSDEGTLLRTLLAGYYTSLTIMQTPGYRFMGVYGYYWTSTKDENKEGEYYFYRKLYANSSQVYRQSIDKSANQLSVKLVRNATN